MHKRTKIISTIGPASRSPILIKKLYDKGMNVIRINMSHTSIADMKKIVNDIKKIRKFRSKFDPTAIKKLGMACSYPGTFNSSIYTIINSKNYKDAILKTIKAGGCNCSRANFTGAYFAALKGINSIPNNWIKKTIPAKKILNQK